MRQQTRQNIASLLGKIDLNNQRINLTGCGFFANIARRGLLDAKSGLMHRMVSAQRLLALAIGCALALPCTIAGAVTPANKTVRSGEAVAVNESSLAQMSESEDAIDAWRDYALNSLKANFSWASDAGVSVEAPSIFNRGRSSLSRTSLLRFPGSAVSEPAAFQVAMQSSRVALSPLYASAESSSLLPDHSPGLHRTVIAPSFSQKLGDAGFFSVSAILAYERFAGFDVNFSNSVSPLLTDASMFAPTQWRNQTIATGAGGRVDFGNAVNEHVSWQAGYQSRVNMDGFSTAEGLYARRAGMFDIPASMNLGLNFKLTREFAADFGVERVMYSAIPPYISTDLPLQVLAQLHGYRDTSFAWQNLIVRSVGLSMRDATWGDLRVGVTSRQQPLPTLPVLQQALSSRLSEHSWEFSYAHAVGEHSMLRLLGVYAPIQLLGAPTASYNLSSADGANQMRVEALWVTNF